MGIGEAAALTTAFLWAAVGLLWSRVNLTAWGINLWKNIAASILLLAHLGMIACWSDVSLFSGGWEAWKWLSLSGLVGIVLGDTLYFRSLQIVGPRRALILSTTAPVFGGALGWLFLGESLGGIQMLGIALTVGGVLWVITEPHANKEAPDLFPGSNRMGTLCGLLAAFCQAAGGLTSKYGMADCDPVEASFIRVFVAAIGAFVAVLFLRQVKTSATSLVAKSTLVRFVPAVIFGTWIGIWLSQVAFKYAGLAVATTLLATCPLFVLPMLRVTQGYAISLRAVLGTAAAIGGIALLVS